MTCATVVLISWNTQKRLKKLRKQNTDLNTTVFTKKTSQMHLICNLKGLNCPMKISHDNMHWSMLMLHMSLLLKDDLQWLSVIFILVLYIVNIEAMEQLFSQKCLIYCFTSPYKNRSVSCSSFLGNQQRLATPIYSDKSINLWRHGSIQVTLTYSHWQGHQRGNSFPWETNLSYSKHWHWFTVLNNNILSAVTAATLEVGGVVVLNSIHNICFSIKNPERLHTSVFFSIINPLNVKISLLSWGI